MNLLPMWEPIQQIPNYTGRIMDIFCHAHKNRLDATVFSCLLLLRLAWNWYGLINNMSLLGRVTLVFSWKRFDRRGKKRKNSSVKLQEKTKWIRNEPVFLEKVQTFFPSIETSMIFIDDKMCSFDHDFWCAWKNEVSWICSLFRN